MSTVTTRYPKPRTIIHRMHSAPSFAEHELALLRQFRRLFLQRLELSARIGVHDFERTGPQRLWLDVSLWVPLARSTPQADELAEVVDYDFVRDEAHALLARGHVQLQETFVDALAERLLAHPAVAAVRVASSKPDVYPDTAAVGVEVFRLKPAPPIG
jgi:dihydroneopterin aldolase